MVASLRRFLETSFTRASGKPVLSEVKGGKLAEAIRYALNRWDGLCQVLDDGRVEIDFNTVERSIRPSRSTARMRCSQAPTKAVIPSLIETCKLNRIDPQAWLSATLTRLVAGYLASARSAHAVDQRARRDVRTSLNGKGRSGRNLLRLMETMPLTICWSATRDLPPLSKQ